MVHEKKGLSSKAKLVLSYIVVFLAAISFFFLDPKFTGYVTTDTYSEPVRITAYGEKEYSFAGNAEGVELNSLMMSGRVYGEGKVSIFLEDENGQRFVVFTNREESAFSLITGLAGKEGKGLGTSQAEEENNGINDNKPGKENKGSEISESKKPEKENDDNAGIAKEIQKPQSIDVGKAKKNIPAAGADENAGKAQESEDKEKSDSKETEEQKQDYMIKKQEPAEAGAAKAQGAGARDEISQDNKNNGAAAETKKPGIKCMPGDIEKVAGLCRECSSYGVWGIWEKCPIGASNAKLVSDNFFAVKELSDEGQNPSSFKPASINNPGWLQNQPTKEQPAMEFSNACKETCLLYIKPNFKLIVEVEEGTILEIGNVTYSVNT